MDKKAFLKINIFVIFLLSSIVLGLNCSGENTGGLPSSLTVQPPSSYLWTQIGPTGGEFPSIVFHPTNKGEVWASGDDGSGLYKSTDYGASWSLVNTGSVNQASFSIRFDPKNPSRIYAPNEYGRGMLRSTDGGNTWIATQSGLPDTGDQTQFLDDLAINPISTNIIYAATHGGLYVSNDYGANFTLVSASALPGGTNPGSTSFRALAYMSNGNLLVGRDDGVLDILPNNGTTWSPLLPSSGVPIGAITVTSNAVYVGYLTGAIYSYTPTFGTGSVGVINNSGTTGFVSTNTIRIIAKSGATAALDTLWVGTFGATTYPSSRWGFFQSTNGGSSWNQLMNGMTGNYIFSVAVDPNNSNNIIVGSGNVLGIYRSTNGGSSFTSSNATTYGTASMAVSQDPSNPQRFIVSNTAGAGFGRNFLTLNGGASWTIFTDPAPDDGVLSFDIDPTNGNNILAGAYKTGMWRSTQGVNGPWTHIINVNQLFDRIIRDKVNAANVYAVSTNWSTASTSLYYSSNGGLSFTPRTAFSAIHIAPHPTHLGEGIVLGNNGSVIDAFASSDFFATRVPLGLSSKAQAEGGFTAVAFNPLNPEEVIVGCGYGGVYKTTNYNSTGTGVNWTKLTTPVTSINIREVLIANRNGKTVYYVATMGGSYGFTPNSTIGLFRSLDGGATWTSLDNGLFPASFFWSMKPDVSSPSNVFYGGMWGGGFMKLTDNQ